MGFLLFILLQNVSVLYYSPRNEVTLPWNHIPRRSMVFVLQSLHSLHGSRGVSDVEERIFNLENEVGILTLPLSVGSLLSS